MRNFPLNNARIPLIQERGAALVIALVILLLMTLIGVTAMQTTTLEEKMAGNLRDRNTAFQAAEAALREGAEWIYGQALRPDPATSPPADGYDRLAVPDFADPTFDAWSSWGEIYGDDKQKDLSVAFQDPISVKSELNFVPDDLDPDTAARGIGLFYYRITSIGYGGSETAESVLEAVIPQRYN